jgi:uncharacterized protein
LGTRGHVEVGGDALPTTEPAGAEEESMKRAVEFYSEGVKLRGDISLPEDLQPVDKRAGIVLCHGYTGVKDLYLPDTAQALNDAGYVVMTFDYKGWGESEGRGAVWHRIAEFSTCRPL